MTQPTPPVSKGAEFITNSVVAVFHQAAFLFPLTATDVMVGLGAATFGILNLVAEEGGYDPDKLRADFVAQFKVPPQSSTGEGG